MYWENISHSRFNYYSLNSTNCSYGTGCKGRNMYLFYESLPKSATGNTNNVMSIDSYVQKRCRYLRKIKWVECMIYTAVENKVDVLKNVVSKRSLEYVIMGNIDIHVAYMLYVLDTNHPIWPHLVLETS